MKPDHPEAFQKLLDEMIARVDTLRVDVPGGEASIRQIESFIVDAKEVFREMSDRARNDFTKQIYLHG